MKDPPTLRQMDPNWTSATGHRSSPSRFSHRHIVPRSGGTGGMRSAASMPQYYFPDQDTTYRPGSVAAGGFEGGGRWDKMAGHAGGGGESGHWDKVAVSPDRLGEDDDEDDIIDVDLPSGMFSHKDGVGYMAGNEAGGGADGNRYGRTNSYAKAVNPHHSTPRLTPISIKIPRARTGRAILGLFNLIFWISGAAVFSYGVALLVDMHLIELSNLLKVELSYYNPPVNILYWLTIGLLLSGGLVFLSGFLGCWASLEERSNALALYVFLLCVVAIGEIALAAIAVQGRSLLYTTVELDMRVNLDRFYGIPGHEIFTRSIDLMQTKFECCGVRGASEYEFSRWRGQTVGGLNLYIPLSCCVLFNQAEDESYLNPHPADLGACQFQGPSTLSPFGRHQFGCIESLIVWGSRQIITLAGIFIGMAALHILGVLISCFLRQQMKRAE